MFDCCQSCIDLQILRTILTILICSKISKKDMDYCLMPSQISKPERIILKIIKESRSDDMGGLQICCFCREKVS